MLGPVVTTIAVNQAGDLTHREPDQRSINCFAVVRRWGARYGKAGQFVSPGTAVEPLARVPSALAPDDRVDRTDDERNTGCGLLIFTPAGWGLCPR